MIVLNAIAMILTYALADRYAGGGWPALDDKLPGRAAFWGGLAASGVGYALYSLPGALVALAWLIWRTPGWKVVPGASITPRGPKEFMATVVRHLIPAPLVAVVATWTGLDPLAAALPLLGFALVAAGLGAWYGAQVDAATKANRPIGDQNVVVELARGAAFGAAVAAALSTAP